MTNDRVGVVMEIYWPVKGGRGNAVLVRGPGSGGRSPLRRVEDAVIGSAGLNPLDIDVKRVVDGDYPPSGSDRHAVDRSGAARCGADRLGRDVPGVRWASPDMTG